MMPFVSFIERSIDQAERDDARWLVLQANTTGAVVSDGELNALIVRMREADVPIRIDFIEGSDSPTVNITSGGSITFGEINVPDTVASSVNITTTRAGRHF